MPTHGNKSQRQVKILAAAIELFDGDKEAAADWMVTPAKSLNGRKPYQLTASDNELEEVLALIRRLAHKT